MSNLLNCGILFHVPHTIWRHNKQSKERENRLRSSLELLCSVLWHLELAYKLGEFPNVTMNKYRTDVLKEGSWLPWALWRDVQPLVTVTSNTKELLVRYEFNYPRHPSFNYLFQSTLIADSAIRLYGVGKILEDKLPSELSSLGKTRRLDEYIEDTYPCQLKHPAAADPTVRSIIFVVAFRDVYAHGEEPFLVAATISSSVHTFLFFRKLRCGQFSFQEVLPYRFSNRHRVKVIPSCVAATSFHSL